MILEVEKVSLMFLDNSTFSKIGWFFRLTNTILPAVVKQGKLCKLDMLMGRNLTCLFLT